MHARNRRVTQRCHNSPDGKQGYRVQVTSQTGSAWRILGILKKSVSWVEFCLGRRRLAFACLPKPGQWPLWRVPHEMGGGRWKSQNRKNVYLSPYVEEPLNSKVIKSFIPELRSHKCFCVSKFLCSMYIYIYIRTLWTFCIPVWIYPFHVSISGYGTKICHSISLTIRVTQLCWFMFGHVQQMPKEAPTQKSLEFAVTEFNWAWRSHHSKNLLDKLWVNLVNAELGAQRTGKWLKELKTLIK